MVSCPHIIRLKRNERSRSNNKPSYIEFIMVLLGRVTPYHSQREKRPKGV